MRKKSTRDTQECRLDLGLYNKQVLRKITGLPVNPMQEIICKERAEMGEWELKMILMGDGM